ncbi:hypothetical protein, partial [Agrobacterium pusense]|uniref:hypothetical protein n=1 Tax=Agrobacterium pusense TaxID=648995 RepID=UPI000D1AEDCA
AKASGCRPSIVGIKQSRRPKPDTRQTSFLGKLVLRIAEDYLAEANPMIEPATAERGDRP